MSATAPSRQHAGRRRLTLPPTAIALLEALAVAALILFLTRLAFLEPRHFGGDFANHAWYIHHQAETLRATHAPSLYIQATSAAFYPIFMFYGGTLFVVGAMLSLLPGVSIHTAEAMLYAGAFAMAYGGWYWLARMAGIRRWFAHAPGIVYITAPCLLTTMYAAQELPQTVATSAVPLVVASAISVGRTDQLRAGPVAALATSTIAFTGSHNLTLLWGSVLLLLGVIAVAAAVPSARMLVPRRGAVRILAIVVPAVSVNAWFLLPDVIYAHHTAIAQRLDDAQQRLRTPHDVLTLGHLLTPGRPDTGDGGGYTLPVLALVWALLSTAMPRSPRGTPWTRLIIVLTFGALALTVLMSHVQVLVHLPSAFVLTQFGGRLTTFALCGICGALIAALALADRPGRWSTGLLVVVLCVGLLQAADQIRHVNRIPFEAPDLPLDTTTTVGLGDYSDGTSAIFRPPHGQRITLITRASIHHDRAVFVVRSRPGARFFTNVMAPAPLVHVEGARVIGRWRARPINPGWLPRWYLTMQIPNNAKGQKHRVTISTARTAPIVAGEIISILGLLGLTAIITSLTHRRIARPQPPVPRPRQPSA